MSSPEQIKVKDLKKGITYYLHFGFDNYGGMPVKLVEIIETPRLDKGSAILKDDSGMRFLVGKRGFLFKDDPLLKVNSQQSGEL